MNKSLLLLFCLWHQLGFAQINEQNSLDVFVLEHEEQSYYHLDQFVQYLEDSNHSLNIEEVMKADTSFIPHDILFNNRKPTHNASYWGKIIVKNPHYHKLKYIFNAAVVGTNYVDVYYLDQDGNIVHKRNGEYVPYHQKDVKKSRTNRVLVELATQSTTAIYFKVRNIDKRIPRFQVNLESLKSFNNEIETRNITQGIFLGVVSIMVLYNLFLYFFSKDKTWKNTSDLRTFKGLHQMHECSRM